jgi:D-alanine-D-alanine ligase
VADVSKIRVAIVFGGRSTEHEISCVSAGSVLAAIDRAKYDVMPVGITTKGRWVRVADDPAALAIRDRRLPYVDDGEPILLPADPTELGAFADVDVVFPLLHGPWGEDGTIQGLLEMAGMPYVGSGVLASAVAMDKEYMKLLLGAAGLPVGKHVVHRLGEDVDERTLAGLEFPVFVKPARGGSSVGISRVDEMSQLSSALAEAHRHDPKALIEEMCSGREIECAVLEAVDGVGAEASLPGEIKVTGSGHSFYDFAAKYLDDAVELVVPADLPDQQTATVQSLACDAFVGLGCAGLARVDFFVDGDNAVINEVNTMPGFTPISMFPRMWGATGVDYPALIDRLLQSALRNGTGLR